MFDHPWPGPCDGPHQPRDAHARAWGAVRRTRPVRRVVADEPRGRAEGRDGAGTPLAGHAPREGTDDLPEVRPPSLRPTVRWEPEPAWIPQPPTAPEQRWDPLADWRADPAPAPATSARGRPVPAVLVPLLAVLSGCAGVAAAVLSR